MIIPNNEAILLANKILPLNNKIRAATKLQEQVDILTSIGELVLSARPKNTNAAGPVIRALYPAQGKQLTTLCDGFLQRGVYLALHKAEVEPILKKITKPISLNVLFGAFGFLLDKKHKLTPSQKNNIYKILNSDESNTKKRYTLIDLKKNTKGVRKPRSIQALPAIVMAAGDTIGNIESSLTEYYLTNKKNGVPGRDADLVIRALNSVIFNKIPTFSEEERSNPRLVSLIKVVEDTDDIRNKFVRRVCPPSRCATIVEQLYGLSDPIAYTTALRKIQEAQDKPKNQSYVFCNRRNVW